MAWLVVVVYCLIYLFKKIFFFFCEVGIWFKTMLCWFEKKLFYELVGRLVFGTFQELCACLVFAFYFFIIYLLFFLTIYFYSFFFSSWHDWFTLCNSESARLYLIIGCQIFFYFCLFKCSEEHGLYRHLLPPYSLHRAPYQSESRVDHRLPLTVPCQVLHLYLWRQA